LFLYMFFTCFVMASVSERKVMDTAKFAAQFTDVASDCPMLLNNILI
jgi:hypothetical protein